MRNLSSGAANLVGKRTSVGKVLTSKVLTFWTFVALEKYLTAQATKPMRLRPIFLAVFVLLTALSTRARAQSVHDFRLSNAAYILNDECIRLTTERPFISGSAWYKDPLDLRGPFEMSFLLVLGKNDELGADGIVFVFHPRIQTGYRGEGMGFSGLRPSLGIEFDTYQNTHLGDPEADHLAIMANGAAWHGVSLAGPVTISNLEDGVKHPVTVSWDPIIQTLAVYVDNELRISYKGDIINEIFGGNPSVYWGATAATGRKFNFQDLCIKKLFYAK